MLKRHNNLKLQQLSPIKNKLQNMRKKKVQSVHKGLLTALTKSFNSCYRLHPYSEIYFSAEADKVHAFCGPYRTKHIKSN